MHQLRMKIKGGSQKNSSSSSACRRHCLTRCLTPFALICYKRGREELLACNRSMDQMNFCISSSFFDFKGDEMTYNRRVCCTFRWKQKMKFLFNQTAGGK